jgi:hypothetical protein
LVNHEPGESHEGEKNQAAEIAAAGTAARTLGLNIRIANFGQVRRPVVEEWRTVGAPLFLW